MKPTDHQSFLDLTLSQKVKALYTDGDFVVAIRYYKYKINLYRFQNMLIEVFYDHKKDIIEKVEILSKSTSRLKFYTDQIKISEIKA